MTDIIRVMLTIVINFWILQLLWHFKEKADMEYQFYLLREEREREIQKVVNYINDILE